MKKILLILFAIAPLTAMETPNQNSKKRKADALEIYCSEPYFRQDTKNLCIDAFAGDTHVGEIQYNSTNTLGRISLMKVVESYRKLGIGFNLFKESILDLITHGCLTITWDAVVPAHKDVLELQTIYVHMVNKLKTIMDIEFSCGPVVANRELSAIPMKIVIKRAQP